MNSRAADGADGAAPSTQRSSLDTTVGHMTMRIRDLQVLDLRFPTSRTFAGSDAMHPDPDYSAAYVILKTDSAAGLEGHGLTFTIGRGNEVCATAIEALRPLVVGERSRRSRQTWQGSGAGSPATRNCDGSAPRRA